MTKFAAKCLEFSEEGSRNPFPGETACPDSFRALRAFAFSAFTSSVVRINPGLEVIVVGGIKENLGDRAIDPFSRLPGPLLAA